MFTSLFGVCPAQGSATYPAVASLHIDSPAAVGQIWGRLKGQSVCLVALAMETATFLCLCGCCCGEDTCGPCSVMAAGRYLSQPLGSGQEEPLLFSLWVSRLFRASIFENAPTS